MVRDIAFAAYFNARIRGMKSRLLTRAELEQLLEYNDLQSVIDTLMDSPYEREMAEALARHQGADAVEEAVNRNLVNTFAKLLKISGGAFRELDGLFLARWDLIAVKSLLRVRHQERDAMTGMQALIPGPSLTVALLQDLARRESMESLVSGLVGWNPAVAAVLAENVPAYTDSGNLQVLEDALDRHYFVDTVRDLQHQKEPDAPYLREYLRMEIDRINLRTIFLMRARLPLEDRSLDRLLPEGTLSERLLRQLLTAESDEAAVALLMRTPYRELEPGLVQYTQRHVFSPLERMIELALVLRLKRTAVTEVLSLAILMHYVWLKYNEVVNLRLIARGLERRLPRDRVREEVLFA
jgi:V/A-type H+/Na+-transporting ATPase subunit C